MIKSKIEWTDYTINPVKGLCPVACSYCYARRMYQRFHWNPEVRFDWSVANDLAKIKKPSRIFWGSTMELFGDWIDPEWIRLILEAVKRHSEHTHIFLTKRPHHLKQWAFPDNAWVGVSTTGNDNRVRLEDIFKPIQAKVKFLSVEPLLGYTPLDFRWVDWVIIGQQTPVSKATTPRIEWLLDLVEQADRDKCKVFLKNNLMPMLEKFGETNSCAKSESRVLSTLFDANGRLRQEYP
jgi:protein gp37